MADLNSTIVRGKLRVTADEYISGNLNVTGTITQNGTAVSLSGHTHDGRYIRTAGSAADASAMTWGTLTAANGYTILSHVASSDGGDWGMVNKGGQIFMQLDGYYYQNEGQYRVADTSDLAKYLPLSGGTLTGALNFKNSTYNTVGDDSKIGDIDVAGTLGLKGANGTTALAFVNKDNNYYTRLVSTAVSANTDITLPSSAGTLALVGDNNHTHSYLPLTGGTTTGTTILNNSFAVYYTVRDSDTRSAARWYNIGVISQREGYLTCTLSVSGYYNYQPPAVSVFMITAMHQSCHIVQLAGDIGRISKVRCVLTDTNKWKLQVLLSACAAGTDGSDRYLIYGNVTFDASTKGYDDTTYDSGISEITTRVIPNSPVATMADSLPANGGTSSYTNYLNITDRLGNGATKLQYLQYAGADDNPTNDWYSHIVMHHNNSNGYYTELATHFHGDNVYFRRKAGSDVQAWKRFAFTPECVKYGGNLTGIGSGSPASTAKTLRTADYLPNGNMFCYNSSGVEYSLLYGFRPSDLAYGTILKWTYSDNYLRMLRCENGTWKTDDWEKISAGYADSAGYAASAGSATDSTKVAKAGDTMTGALTVNSTGNNRANINLVTIADQPNDLYFGSNNTNHWSITSRHSSESNNMLLYSTKSGIGTAVEAEYNTGIINFKKGITVSGAIHSNASATNTTLSRIPAASEVALETGDGNGAVSAWIWREKYDPSNWGLFHDNSADTVHFVGNGESRLGINLSNGAVTIPGTLTAGSFSFNNSDIAEGAANLSATAAAHTMSLYRNGITIPYQMDNANDGGMLRCRGTSESNCIFEMATWDDSGGGETIQFNYYPTTSQVTPTYSVTVPKASGTIALDGDYIERREWWNSGDAHDANDLLSGATFAYSGSHANCPTTGTLVSFVSKNNATYPLQLQGSYYGENMYFRNRNGDNGTWNTWREVIHSGNIGSQSVSYANGSTIWHRTWERAHDCNIDLSTQHSQTRVYMYDSASGNNPSGTSGGFLFANAWDWGGGGSVIAQVFDDGDNGRLYVKTHPCEGSWTGWKKIAYSGESQPASDVYSWAKASSKPSYTHDEIGAGNIVIGDGGNTYYYRTASSLKAGFYYHTSGDESVVFANQYAPAGWMFVNGVNPDDRTSWQSVTPTLQIKNGSVVINKLLGQSASSSYKLEVNGSAAATSFYASSDRRLKDNIIKSDLDCLDIINKLKLKEFNFKDQENKDDKYFGLIAQQLLKTLPDKYKNTMVSQTKDKKHLMSINEGKLQYVTMGAVQQLSKKVDKLEKENKELKEIIKEMNKKLNKLLAGR